MEEEKIIMDKQFFINGSWVSFRILEEFLNKENYDKTIKEFLEEKNLLGKEHYLLNPTFLIETLYGLLFVEYENKIKSNTNFNGIHINTDIAEKISRYIGKHFTIIKNIESNKKNEYKYPLYIIKLRNSLAHFHIELEQSDNKYLIFKDKHPNEKDYHFIAAITIAQLKLFLEEISKLF
ncbi:HEPN family nuclease [Anaerofustis sp. HA2171]|uniref:HEPN family nuclease n=1 Tax=Anaerofustis butyriciformans TaxID=3108533 RepID=UPI002E2FBE0F|nr:HEPN family nuclease [Anaerofustis sp. HA2171]